MYDKFKAALDRSDLTEAYECLRQASPTEAAQYVLQFVTEADVDATELAQYLLSELLNR